MNEETNVCDEQDAPVCNNRREFFVKASTIAGGLALSLSGLKGAVGQTKSGDKAVAVKDDATEEAVLKFDEKSPLNKAGGFEIVETKAGKFLIIRNADLSFSAYQANCTHKGGKLKYDEKTGQIVCPSHGSRFDLKGQVVKGPAEKPLPTFTTQNALVVALKPKA
jgi:cytochrome b6-f complex iron-sulfur subunit